LYVVIVGWLLIEELYFHSIINYIHSYTFILNFKIFTILLYIDIISIIIAFCKKYERDKELSIHTRYKIGDGTEGYVDGDGIKSKFNCPTGITIDKDGNIFIADYFNHRIRKLSKSGFVSTIAGSGTCGYKDGNHINSQFNYPYGLVIDKDGYNLFVADAGNHSIRQIKIKDKYLSNWPSTHKFLNPNCRDEIISLFLVHRNIPFDIKREIVLFIIIIEEFTCKSRSLEKRVKRRRLKGGNRKKLKKV